MSKSFYGSMCHSDYMEMLKSGKFKGMKSDKSGKVYVNIQVWENDEPDQFGNSMSIKLVAKDEFKDEKPKSFIANLKVSEAPKPTEPAAEEFNDDDDLPF